MIGIQLGINHVSHTEEIAMNPVHSESSYIRLAVRAYSRLAFAAGHLKSLLLAGVRGYWGWQFFLTGKAHLLHLQATTDFFTQLHLPAPKLQAIMAGGTECAGGLLLLLGVASRLVSLPLIGTMVVAYLAADADKVKNIFHDPDAFVTAAPFLFLLASILVFVLGPGKISTDNLIKKFLLRRGAGADRETLSFIPTLGTMILGAGDHAGPRAAGRSGV